MQEHLSQLLINNAPILHYSNALDDNPPLLRHRIVNPALVPVGIHFTQTLVDGLLDLSHGMFKKLAVGTVGVKMNRWMKGDADSPKTG